MIRLEQISFSYGEKQIFRDYSLSVSDGELIAVMGPSGSGKTTLLHLLAGLRKPQGGTIQCDESRPVYVFQEPRLFPWLSVRENILAVLPGDASPSLPDEMLELVGLSEDADSMPDSLSGGMKSRVSLARALAYGSAVGSSLYLLDEPFSALDEALRNKLCKTLKERFRSIGAGALLVTHDSEEASLFGDRVLTIGTEAKSNLE